VCVCEVLHVGGPLSVACVSASVPQRVVLCVDCFILVVCAFGWGYLWMPFVFALVLGVYVAVASVGDHSGLLVVVCLWDCVLVIVCFVRFAGLCCAFDFLS